MTPLPSRALPAVSVKRTPKWPIALAVIGAIAIGGVAWKLVSDKKASTTPVAQVAEPSLTPPPAAAVQPPTDQPAPAQPPPVVAPARGTLDVDVQGSKDALIFVDGEERGQGASIKLELDPGSHEIVVKAPKRPDIKKTVDITAGSVSSVAVVVPPLPGTKPPRHTKRTPKTTPKKQTGDDELLTPKRK
jgi:hypothetical protein